MTLHPFRTLLTLALLGASVSAQAQTRPRGRINLDVKNADVQNVLRLLAEVGHLNLVTSDQVTGQVTVKLRNVPWQEALSVVLRAKGLGQEKIGNVVQVDTLERITQRAQAAAELAQARQETATLVTVMLPLSYAQASDLAPLVKGLLTPRGSVQIDARTNVLIVTDVAENVDHVRNTLSL